MASASKFAFVIVMKRLLNLMVHFGNVRCIDLALYDNSEMP